MDSGSYGPWGESFPEGMTDHLLDPVDLRRGRPRAAEPSLLVDLYETADDLVVIALVPGASVNDLEVTATGQTVTIRGTIPSAADRAEADQWNWYLHEIPHGAFTRTLDFPVEVDPENARAVFQDGLLRLAFPKVEIAHRQRLTIRASDHGSEPIHLNQT